MEVKEQETEIAERRLDLEAIRAKLRGKTGKAYWRSLDELADTPEFDRFMEDEFPNRSTIGQINRRDLLKYMGASLALAGLTGCRGVFMPQEKLVPYVKAPEELVPGIPLFYASTVMLAGYATGVLVEQHEGRPIKLEGNPEHPASLGALDSLSQAEILNLYDPDRTTAVSYHGDISTWELFQDAIDKELVKARGDRGAGIRILTGAISSPTQLEAIHRFLQKYPAATWHWHEPVGRGTLHQGIALAHGSAVDPIFDFTKAKTVLSLDSDFLSPTGNPGSLRYARDWADGRRVEGPVGTMSRLYAIESVPTIVGVAADHRWAVKPSQVYPVALAIAEELGLPVSGGALSGIDKTQVSALVADLKSNEGLVVCGDLVDPEVHALVYAMNQAIGASGKSVKYIPPVNAAVGKGTIADLTAALTAGSVDLLLIFGVNPVYDAPADLAFADSLKKGRTNARSGLRPLVVHYTYHENETSAYCDWILPATHTLEEWGDGRAYDGSVSMIQPLIAPLFDGRSVNEVFWALSGDPKPGYEILRGFWMPKMAGPDKEKSWRRFVHDGVLPHTAFSAAAGGGGTSLASLPAPKPATGLEIAFRPDPTIYDGRFANNGWLQELPKPLTKLTWDNVAMISPATAIANKVGGDDVVKLSINGRSVEAGVFVQPGHPDDSVTLRLGYGRVAGGVVATPWKRSESDEPSTYLMGEFGGGFDAYQFRNQDTPVRTSGAQMEIVGGQISLASTQTHQPLDKGKEPLVGQMEGSVISQSKGDDRVVLLEFPLIEFLDKGKEEYEKRQEQYKEYESNDMFVEKVFEWDGEQWAMTIDLNTCIGCNACVTACQAENNIPVVGKPMVGRHREMHWIRIDRYYRGDEEAPEISFQPIMCMHCEKAPCEPVCPVAATVHSHDGLNQMIYNRCVGTRYCSNNCPYKVRRFNFLNYTDNQIQYAAQTDDKARRPLLKMLNNPDVTVRGRGVMEKCTYCVQRINSARIESKKTQVPLKDGDIVTACQQACPTKTIVFGNQQDPSTRVAKLRKDPRSYLLLQELLTYPRTSHLAKLRNPNPAIPTAVAAE